MYQNIYGKFKVLNLQFVFKNLNNNESFTNRIDLKLGASYVSCILA